MKMKRKNKIIICYMCCIAIAILTGCGIKQQSANEDRNQISKNEENETYNVRQEIVEKTVAALDSKNTDEVEALFYTPAIRDKGLEDVDRSEIDRFLSAYSGSKRVLYNDGSFIAGDYSLDNIKYETYSAVVALVETEDNLYSLNFFFCDSKKNKQGGLIALQIVTAKSEAYCNACLKDEYIAGNNASFSYIDVNDNAYDEIASEYRIIMSQILCYDENTTVVTEEEANQFIKTDVTTKEEILNQLGEPAAVYTDVGDIVYYSTNVRGKYLQITYYDDKEIVRRYDIVGELYPNWIEL